MKIKQKTKSEVKEFLRRHLVHSDYWNHEVVDLINDETIKAEFGIGETRAVIIDNSLSLREKGIEYQILCNNFVLDSIKRRCSEILDDAIQELLRHLEDSHNDIVVAFNHIKNNSRDKLFLILRIQEGYREPRNLADLYILLKKMYKYNLHRFDNHSRIFEKIKRCLDVEVQQGRMSQEEYESLTCEVV